MKAITYPARPINGGRLELAPPKSGAWLFEPKYNGWRALVHAPTGTMFNRYGERLTIEHEFARALALLQNSPFEWLDCEALERRHGIGRGTLMVFDFVGPGLFHERKMSLAEHLASHRMEEKPENEAVYLVPSWSNEQIKATELYSRLRSINTQWHCEFYEGLVFKRADSTYPVQTRSATIEFPGWVKHRFI